MEKFLNSNSLLKLPSNVESAFQENSSDSVLVNTEKEKLQYDYLTLQERFNELLETHNNLKNKYSSLEKENINLRFLNQNLQLKLLDPSGKCNDMRDEQTVQFSDESQSKKKQLDLEISAIPPIVVQAEEYELNDDLRTSSPILSHGQCSNIKGNSKTDVNEIPKTDLNETQKTDFNDSIDKEMAQGYQSHCSTPTRKRVLSSSNSDTETPSRHIAKKLHFHDHESQKDNENINKDSQIKTKERKLHKTEEKTIKNCSKKSKIEKEVNKCKENKADNSLDKVAENKIKTSTEKHEKKRIEKSKDKNENNENNEAGQPEFLSKCEVEEDGEKVYKCYLGEGIYINQDTWKDILNVQTSNRFIVALLKEFYTPQQLSKRSLSGSDAWKTPNGVHTRQKLTPKKYRVIKQCTKYYLKKRFKLTPSQLDKQMSLNNKHITGYISKVVNSMKSNKPKEKKIVKPSDEDEESETKEQSDVSIESDNNS